MRTTTSQKKEAGKNVVAADGKATSNPLQLKQPANNPLQLQAEETTISNLQQNHTGLPDDLKAGAEALSGYSMDDVKVHYNSDSPAQVQALAYAQGTDIHIAPGQEKHLPHETWHVVQQKQGRVQPTLQMKEGTAVNDDKGLEHEADVMAQKIQDTKPGVKQMIPLRTNPNVQLTGLPIQKYSIIDKPIAQLSEDAEVLLTKEKALFSTSDRLENSNKELGNAGPFGSMIRLEHSGKGNTLEGHPGKKFYKVTPYVHTSSYFKRLNAMPGTFHQDINKQTGPRLSIWADCRRASELVTGASSALGTDDKKLKLGDQTVDRYNDSIKRPSGIANDNATARLAFQVYATRIKPFLYQHSIKALLPERLKENFPEFLQLKAEEEKNWFVGLLDQAQNNISIAERLYDSLKPGAKELFHKETGTNEFANPKIGDAYSTVTEYGMPGFKPTGDDWAFHWGGVIMKGGSDNITLENLSVGNEKIKNTDWFFAMYGTVSKAQTFHERQKATTHHGNIATTIVVETEFSDSNRKLQDIKDQINGLKKAESSIGADFRLELIKKAVEYNELAESLNRDRITEYELLGSDRKFTTADKQSIHTLKRIFIPV